MNKAEIPQEQDKKITRIISGKPIISRSGETIGWAVRDGSLDYA